MDTGNMSIYKKEKVASKKRRVWHPLRQNPNVGDLKDRRFLQEATLEHSAMYGIVVLI